RALRHLVADLYPQVAYDAGHRRRDLHRGLVRFDRDQRLLRRDTVAGLDQHFDDLDVFEIADVGNLDLDHVAHGLLSGRYRPSPPTPLPRRGRGEKIGPSSPT